MSDYADDAARLEARFKADQALRQEIRRNQQLAVVAIVFALASIALSWPTPEMWAGLWACVAWLFGTTP